MLLARAIGTRLGTNKLCVLIDLASVIVSLIMRRNVGHELRASDDVDQTLRLSTEY